MSSGMCFSPSFPKAVNNVPLISLGRMSVESKDTLGAFPEGPAAEMGRMKSPLRLAVQMRMSFTTVSYYTARPRDKAALGWIRPRFLACLAYLDT